MTRLVLDKSSSPRLPWMLMAAVLAASAAVAQEHQAIETIAAGKGAHPIRGAKLRPDGSQIVFAQSFDRDCQLSPESLPSPSIAGTVSGNIRLEVSTMSCPPSAAPPTADCRWRIEPAPVHDSSCRELGAFEPLEGQGLDLEMPPRTGIYELSLSCRFRPSGTVTRETFRLFVTYSEPLISVSPAAADWFERASCWGAGFDRQSDENSVVEAMLRGIYAYGGQHWRYGYATKCAEKDACESDARCHGENQYLFTELGGETECIETDEAMGDNVNYQRCPWTSLVREGSACNFADCFVFSDVLQHISATFGVGGLLACDECTITGKLHHGFVTVPESESLDPKFPRCVDCYGHSGPCPTYQFGSHSLLWRDGKYFDATFQRVYASPAEPIYWNQKSDGGKIISFLETKLELSSEGRGYGNWYFSRLPAEDEARAHVVRPLFARRPVLIRKKSILFGTRDRAGDGVFEALTVEMDLEIRQQGAYFIHGALLKKGMITKRPDGRTPHASRDVVSGKPGVYKAKLAFSGQDIYQSGKAGPYRLWIWVTDRHGILHHAVTRRTESYAYEKFGEFSAFIESVETHWVSEPQSPEATLVAEPRLVVRAPETFVVELRLAQDGKTLAYAGERCADGCRSRGTVPLRLEVPVGPSRRDAPYQLSLSLFEGPHLTPLRVWIDESLEGPAASSGAPPPLPRR